MKKFKLLKKLFAFCAVILTVLLAVPMQAFAVVETYCVYEDFDSQSSVSGIAEKFVIMTSNSTKTSGTIDLAKYEGNQCLKYAKTLNEAGIEHYTDVYFGSKASVAEEGSKYVFEVTFWYTGSLEGVTFSNEFVGGRKTNENGKAKIQNFLNIANGNLYTGKGLTEDDLVTALEPNKKYTVAISVNDAEAKYSIYLQNSPTAVKKNVPYASENGVTTTRIRGINLTGMVAADAASLPVFYADDFKLYYADKPKCAGGVPSSVNSGNTDTGSTEENNPIPVTPTTPNTSTSGDNVGTIKLPTVEKKDFKFTATPQSSVKAESQPVTLEPTKDILCICGIGGGAVVIIALAIIFGKKLN